MIEFVQQWPFSFTHKKNEQIDSIVYNNRKLVGIELRFSATLNYLWSLPLDSKCNMKIIFHCYLLSSDQWLVADDENVVGCILQSLYN